MVLSDKQHGVLRGRNNSWSGMKTRSARGFMCANVAHLATSQTRRIREGPETGGVRCGCRRSGVLFSAWRLRRRS
jgi:hypothetical protein